MAVVSAWSQMDDPDKSAVIDKVEFAPTPHAPGFSTASGLGHWLGGIAKNIPDDRKRGAFEFLKWFQTREAQLANAKFGGIPINAASYRDPISQERKFRWMKPLADSLQHAVSVYQFPESSEVIAILELGLNQAVARQRRGAGGAQRHGGQDPRRDDQIRLPDRQAASRCAEDGMDASVSASTARGVRSAGAPIRPHGAPDDPVWRWITLSPALLMMLLLSVLPLVNLFLTSFYTRDLVRAAARSGLPAGLANYAALARDDLLQAGVINTLIFAVFAVGGQMLLGFVARAALCPRDQWPGAVPDHLHPADPDSRHRRRRDLEAAAQFRLRPRQPDHRPCRLRPDELARRQGDGAGVRHPGRHLALDAVLLPAVSRRAGIAAAGRLRGRQRSTAPRSGRNWSTSPCR